MTQQGINDFLTYYPLNENLQTLLYKNPKFKKKLFKNHSVLIKDEIFSDALATMKFSEVKDNFVYLKLTHESIRNFLVYAQKDKKFLLRVILMQKLNESNVNFLLKNYATDKDVINQLVFKSQAQRINLGLKFEHVQPFEDLDLFLNWCNNYFAEKTSDSDKIFNELEKLFELHKDNLEASRKLFETVNFLVATQENFDDLIIKSKNKLMLPSLIHSKQMDSFSNDFIASLFQAFDDGVLNHFAMMNSLVVVKNESFEKIKTVLSSDDTSVSKKYLELLLLEEEYFKNDAFMSNYYGEPQQPVNDYETIVKMQLDEVNADVNRFYSEVLMKKIGLSFQASELVKLVEEKTENFTEVNWEIFFTLGKELNPTLEDLINFSLHI